MNDIFNTINVYPPIQFLNSSKQGYVDRTIKNASADATIAVASNFNTAGEKLTKNSVLKQSKLYIPISVKYDLRIVNPALINLIVNEFNKHSIKTINIAGNGIYTFKGQYTQEDLNNFMYNLLGEIIHNKNLITPIEYIRSGGQTGIDEAGIKAALKLGVPAIVYAPKDWLFKDINGITHSNELFFKQRFYNELVS